MPNPLSAAPGPQSPLGLGVLLDLLRTEPWDLLYRYAQTYGDLFKIDALHLTALFVNRPDLIETLVDSHDMFVKRTPNPSTLPFTRKSIFATTRPLWAETRPHHPYAGEHAPLVFERMIPALVDVVTEHVRTMGRGPAGTVDLYPLLVRMSYDAFCTNVLGQRTSDATYIRYLRLIREVTTRLKTNGTTLDPRFWWVLRRWHQEISEVVDRRFQQGADAVAPTDALGFVTKNGTKLPRDILKDEVSTMIVGGVHPVATALSAALYNLCRYPDEGRRVMDEVRDVASRRDLRTLTLADVKALECLDRFADESMRLYPPVHIIMRAVLPGKVGVLGGYALPANTEVVFSPWVMHRTARYWEAPLEFRPARFAKAPAPYTFMPFGVGERTCMGQPYARLCIRIVLATLLTEANIEVNVSKPLALAFGPLIIVPKNPLHGQLSLR